MRRYPVSVSDIHGYALAVHDAVSSPSKSLTSMMYRHGVKEFQAKLIDGFIIDHEQEIWEWMQREFNEVWY